MTKYPHKAVLRSSKTKGGVVEAENKTVATRPQSSAMAVVLKLASNPDVSVDKLDRLMQMAERQEAKEARKSYIRSMAEFKTESMKILKTKTVSFGNTHYKHATLDQICEVVDPFLSQHGFSKSWSTEQTDKQIKVTCTVTHIEGHSENVSLSAPPDTGTGRNDIQAIISTTTYLKRHTLLEILGMAAKDEDDDGRGGGGSKTLPDEDFERLKKKIKAATTKAAAEKVAMEASAACKKYNDLDSNNLLRGVYSIHIGTLAS